MKGRQFAGPGILEQQDQDDDDQDDDERADSDVHVTSLLAALSTRHHGRSNQQAVDGRRHLARRPPLSAR
jgi:hypothetical protein